MVSIKRETFRAIVTGCGRAALVAAFAAACLHGQTIGVPSVTPVGMGCRAYAMGNNYAALSDDAAAMFFNPAGLAFTPIREFSFALSGMVRTSDAAFEGIGTTEKHKDKERLRLGSISLVRAFPTTQGGFAIAIGYQTPYVLDDIVAFNGSFDSAGSTISVDNTYYTSGQFNLWTGAFGIQIAPNFSVGGALSFVSGRGSMSLDFRRYTNGRIQEPKDDDYSIDIRQSYYGLDARAGLMYAVTGRMAAGLRVEAPQLIRFGEAGEAWTGYSTGSSDYETWRSAGRLEGSYGGALGFAYFFPFMKTTVEIRGRSPYPDAAEGSDLSYWRLGAGVGAEAPLPLKPLLVRAGYSWNEYDAYPLYANYQGEADVQADASFENDAGQHLVSGGMAYLTASGISFELSYAYRFWAIETSGTLSEFHGMHRVLAAVSIRY